MLVSDGTTVYAEGVTGKDGVWQLDTDRAARRVLVLAGAHAASSEWEPGQTFAEGWQTKVHVSTDRPVYRPGQKVDVARRSSAAPTAARTWCPKAVKAVAVLLNARGAEVERAGRDVLATSASSTATFTLDAEAPLGDWSIRLDVDGRSFPGTFRVLEYRKPEFTVDGDSRASRRTRPARRSRRRSGSRYTFGGAVAGAPVEWQVTRVPARLHAERGERLLLVRPGPRGARSARGEAARHGAAGRHRGPRRRARPTTRARRRSRSRRTERDEDAEYVVTRERAST